MAFNQTSEGERDLLSFPLTVAKALRHFEKARLSNMTRGKLKVKKESSKSTKTITSYL